MTLHMTKITIGFFALTLGLVGCGHNSMPETTQQGQKLQAQGEIPKSPELKADTRFAAGQLAESQGNTAVAIKQYKEALKTDSNHLASMYRLALVYSQIKQYDEALTTWQDYVRATNNSATAYSNLGFCYELAGRNQDAETSYQKGIAKDNKSVSCRTNYGLMLARHNRVGEAVRIWQPVLSEAEIHYNLASVYELDGRKFEARSEYQKALQLDPKFNDAKSRLAELELK